LVSGPLAQHRRKAVLALLLTSGFESNLSGLIPVRLIRSRSGDQIACAAAQVFRISKNEVGPNKKIVPHVLVLFLLFHDPIPLGGSEQTYRSDARARAP